MSLRRNQKGHAMLELAISAGVMVTCLSGTFQFGYTFYTYNQLVSAVGNGARYASMRPYRAASDEDVQKSIQAIRNMVVYGDPHPALGAAPVVANLQSDQIEVKWIQEDSSAPTSVSVSLKNYSVNGLFGAFDFSGRPAVEFPFVGTYAPSEREP